MLLAVAAIAGICESRHGYTRCVPSRGFRGERRPGLGRPAGPWRAGVGRPGGRGRCRAALTEGGRMTLISFVVPAFRVQGYLRECLDSILGQPYDRHRGDRRRRLLAGRQRRDPRPSTRPATPGSARFGCRRTSASVRPATSGWTGPSASTCGSSTATTGWRPTACREVADRLRATRPDVLLVDHVRVHWNDTRHPQRHAGGLPGAARRRPPSGCADRPEALRLLHTAWNRLVRREFLVEPRAALRARLVRGRLVQLSGADGRASGSACWTGSASTTGSAAPARSPGPGATGTSRSSTSGTGCSA